MARLGSQAIAGYYPTPDHLIPAIARLINPSAGATKYQHTGEYAASTSTYALCDPCAGDGAALVAVAHALFGRPLPGRDRGPALKIYAGELEGQRAAALDRQLRAVFQTPQLRYEHESHVVKGDAFLLSWGTLMPRSRAGISLLWLNPPYDVEPGRGRLETAFLDRFTPILTPGTGILVYLVPYGSLGPVADLLAREYDTIHAFRFPDADWAAYHQVVLLARRRLLPLTLAGATADQVAQIRQWSTDPTRLPVLDPAAPQPTLYALPAGARDGLVEWVRQPLDFAAVAATVRPWTAGSTDVSSGPLVQGHTAITRRRGLVPLGSAGVDRGLADFLTQVQPVAQQPKPAYLALLLASGALNGLRATPDDPASGLPEILIKGWFRKNFKTVERKSNADGQTTALVQVESPLLSVTVLALTDPPHYIDIAAGTTPACATTLDKMNVPDLLLAYGQSLARLITAQFPPLHRPEDTAARLPLPVVARPPLAAQAEAVQTLLKLLGSGENPIDLGQVGTGKTEMTLVTLEALTPQNFPATAARLRALGLWDPTRPLTPIRTAGVLCPPHLIETWRDEARAVLPAATVIHVQSISDLRPPPVLEPGTIPTGPPGTGLTIYVLSRETAKLGHAWRDGRVAGRCPRCGGYVDASAAQVVSRHLRCPHQVSRNYRPVARITKGLAFLLTPAFPDVDAVAALLPTYTGQATGRRDGGAIPRPPVSGRMLLRWRQKCLAAYPKDAPATVAAWRRAQWQRVAGPDARSFLTLEKLIAALRAEILREYEAHRSDTYYTGLAPLLTALQLLHWAAPDELRPHLVTQTVERLYGVTARDRLNYGLGARVRDALRQLLLLNFQGPTRAATEAPLRAQREDRAAPANGDPWTAYDTALDRLTRAVAGQPARIWGYSVHVDDWPAITWDAARGTLAWAYSAGQQVTPGAPEAARAALDVLIPVAGFLATEPCNEPLYQAIPQPRRLPLARVIARRYPNLADFWVLDEIQEFNHSGSAQEQAAHQLCQLGKPTLGLTGSLMGGYASSLFANLWAFSRRFRRRYGQHDKAAFVREYGYRKRLVLIDPDAPEATVRAYAKQSLGVELEDDVRVKQLGEAPGVLPTFLPRELLPLVAVVHKDDLGIALPPMEAHTWRVGPWGSKESTPQEHDQDLLNAFLAVQEALVQQIKDDRFTELQGRLWGAMAELPSYPDLCTADVGNALAADGTPVYEVRYSANAPGRENALVATAPLFPASYRTPKERAWLGLVAEEIAAGRNVILGVRHTGNARLVARYLRLLAATGLDAVYLDRNKVPPKHREAWIRAEVVGKGRRVLLVNPETIKTGLNCLTPYFKSLLWVEMTYNALTIRQANGRIHRLGSDPAHPIRVYMLVYGGTSQDVALDLIVRKVTVSEQMDGLSVESELEAAGAGDADDDADGVETMSIGQALFTLLQRQAPRPRLEIPPPVAVTTTTGGAAPQAPGNGRLPERLRGKEMRQLDLFAALEGDAA